MPRCEKKVHARHFYIRFFKIGYTPNIAAAANARANEQPITAGMDWGFTPQIMSPVVSRVNHGPGIGPDLLAYVRHVIT